MRDFGDLMRRAAPLLGYDPQAANRKGEARYRSRGSLLIDYRRGLFADYEAGEAGGVLDFIELETGERPTEWLRRNNIGASEPAASKLRGRTEEDLGDRPPRLTSSSASLSRARSGTSRSLSGKSPSII